jgi:hypothetical protein
VKYVHFFVIASLMGGWALITDTMNITLVIHVERSESPVNVAIFPEWIVCFILKKLRGNTRMHEQGCRQDIRSLRKGNSLFP